MLKERYNTGSVFRINKERERSFFVTYYINYWKNYVNFGDRTTRRGFWMFILFNIIASFVVGLIAGLIKLDFLTTVWALANLLPGLAIAVRRLRDAGKAWGWIFINLIPLVGQIIYLIFLLKPSVADDGTPVV